VTHFRHHNQRLDELNYHTELLPLDTIDLFDLKVLNEVHAYNFLPYPFMHTRPAEFDSVEDVAAHASGVRERYAGGDLKYLDKYMLSYAGADICVTLNIQYIPNDTPSVRIVAHRKDEQGFLAEQRSDVDLVDVYQLSPYELGAAISQKAPLDQPGRHAAIVVNEYLPPDPNVYDSGDFAVSETFVATSEVTIPQEEVSAYASIQSHWRRRAKWGPDWNKETLVWIQVRDDGDYIFAPDMASAQPMTRSLLHERIDRLIAEDVAILREKRRGLT
jgi:hypothetical protein